MQLEIGHLWRKLRCKQRRESPSILGSSSDGDSNYRPRSRTPPNESFSYNEEHRHKRRSRSPTYRGLGNNAISKALRQISKSLFTRKIKRAKLPRQFTQPIFTMYNNQTDPMEHVSHFNQKMAINSKNEVLMYKVFPSSLGPITMRWFDGLGEGSINSFKELTQAFGSRFITCSRVPQPLDSLLSTTMQEGKTLKIYSDRY